MNEVESSETSISGIEYATGYDAGRRDNNTMLTNPTTIYGSSIIKLTDTSEVLRNIEFFLRNVFERDGKLYRIGEQRLSDEGISEVIGLLHAVCSRNTHMSNYETKEIRNMMLGLIYELNKMFMVYGRRWGLERTRRGLISYTILQTVYSSFKRGYRQGDKQFLKGTQQEIKTTVESNTSSKGLFSKIPIFGSDK